MWCRSEFFRETLLMDETSKQIDVGVPSHLLVQFMDYVHEGALPRDIDDDLIQLAEKVSLHCTPLPIRNFIIYPLNQWSLGMQRSIAHFLVESVINTKNVFDWTKRTRNTFPELHAYCVWFMRVNHSSIKSKKEYAALSEYVEVERGAWPGHVYEYKYERWKGVHGKKKGTILYDNLRYTNTLSEIGVLYNNWTTK